MFKTKSMYEKIKISDSVKEQFDLKGKSAIITGGAGFLGIQFSETIAECSSAVAASHGIKEAFSTGSQNHQPPQPSS